MIAMPKPGPSDTGTVDGGRDERKTAAFAAAMVRPVSGSEVVRSFSRAREILRSADARQAGASADRFADDDPDHTSVFYLDGEAHRQKRSALARYFTPKAIKERYHAVMEASTARVIAEFRKTGRGRLDLMSFQLTCDVTAEIVGLTESEPAAMARRIRRVLNTTGRQGLSGWRKHLYLAAGALHSLNFFAQDIRPAIRARRLQPRDDILSMIIGEGYSNLSIFVECISYGTAGMLTTREFIVMAAWHLLERDDLREQFLGGDEAVQFAILDEILRLEPISAMIQRKQADRYYAIDIRAANTDEEVTGPHPFAIDPERAKRQRMATSWMSFGDGPHRCPGAQIAMYESRLFLDRLMRVPGIRLANPPTFGWFDTIMSYELRGAFVECERLSKAEGTQCHTAP